MGSKDIPPSHVPSHVIPVSDALLAVGGAFWTLCYILLARRGIQTRSYGMPLFALALNFGWELVFALFVTEEPKEQFGFTVWLIIDIGLVYCLIAFGKNEWYHTPFVRDHIPGLFFFSVVFCVLLHGSFSYWWIVYDISIHRGKRYLGRVACDTTELGYWTALFCQMNLSVTSLFQLLQRGHSGGVTYGIWATRSLGTLIGLYGYFTFRWWFWPEGHDYLINPFSLFMIGIGALADIAYPFALAQVRSEERTLGDGRKIPKGAIELAVGYRYSWPDDERAHEKKTRGKR